MAGIGDPSAASPGPACRRLQPNRLTDMVEVQSQNLVSQCMFAHFRGL